MMVSKLDDLPVWLGLPLILLGIGTISLLPGFLAALWEKHRVRVYQPIEGGTPPAAVGPDGEDNPYAAPRAREDAPAETPYASAINRAAAGLGFRYLGPYRDGKGRLYRIRYDLWLSADREAIAVVGGGTLAGIPLLATWLHTRFADDRRIVTTDNQAAMNADLSGLSSWALVANADLDELLRRHRLRAAEAVPPVVAFAADDPYGDFLAYRAEPVERLVAAGLGRFLDADRDVWRYTLKGAARATVQTFARQLGGLGRNVGRNAISRPGQPGYLPSKVASPRLLGFLRQFEAVCLIATAFGAYSSLAHGPARTPAQAAFRATLALGGLAGFVICQVIRLGLRRRRDEAAD